MQIRIIMQIADYVLYYILSIWDINHICLIHRIKQTPPKMKNGKITLATDKSLALYGQKHTTTEGSSRIDVTQAIDEKFVIFQVRATINTSNCLLTILEKNI